MCISLHSLLFPGSAEPYKPHRAVPRFLCRSPRTFCPETSPSLPVNAVPVAGRNSRCIMVPTTSFSPGLVPSSPIPFPFPPFLSVVHCRQPWPGMWPRRPALHLSGLLPTPRQPPPEITQWHLPALASWQRQPCFHPSAHSPASHPSPTHYPPFSPP